jgi:hypothetical protein
VLSNYPRETVIGLSRNTSPDAFWISDAPATFMKIVMAG